MNACVTTADGNAEVTAALKLIADLPSGHKTVGADKGYDQRSFIDPLRELRAVLGHVLDALDRLRDRVRHLGAGVGAHRR